jgi:hypothetical protein
MVRDSNGILGQLVWAGSHSIQVYNSTAKCIAAIDESQQAWAPGAAYYQSTDCTGTPYSAGPSTLHCIVLPDGFYVVPQPIQKLVQILAHSVRSPDTGACTSLSASQSLVSPLTKATASPAPIVGPLTFSQE